MRNSKYSENQQFYSRQWVDGATDPYANINYISTLNERNYRLKNGHMYGDNIIGYNGYLNGAKAQLEKKEKR